jgi:hypothetical protein
MAYLNFFEAFSGHSTEIRAVDALTVAPAPVAGFSAVEWLVIGLAERDGLSSLSAPGRIARAFGGLFGLSANSRLADERLEQLRRFAVLVRHHGWRVPASEVEAFLSLFSTGQLETVIASATRRKALAAKRIAA